MCAFSVKGHHRFYGNKGDFFLGIVLILQPSCIRLLLSLLLPVLLLLWLLLFPKQRERGRQTDKLTDRQAGRQADRQTDKERAWENVDGLNTRCLRITLSRRNQLNNKRHGRRKIGKIEVQRLQTGCRTHASMHMVVRMNV